MSRAPTIARRELSSYFYSPIAYVALTVFLGVSGFLFYRDFQPGQPAGMRNLFYTMVWILIFIVPVLCMGLLAQEWASGTLESLMTAPLGETDVVIGKFLGSFSFFIVLLLPTLVYVIVLKTFAHVDLWPIAAGYLGILLVGALFISIGLFCSALTRSQVVAAVSAVTILFLITGVPWLVETQSGSTLGKWRSVTEQGVLSHYIDFPKGTIDTGHLVFFLVVTAVFLFVTVKVLESRRWK